MIFHRTWNKGLHIQTNTGRTHFKKGITPWNKGRKFTKEEMIHWKPKIKFPKKCRICGKEANNEKELEEFVTQKGASFNKTTLCKKCYSSYRKIHGKQNPETVKKNSKKHYQKYKKQIIKKTNLWRKGKWTLLYRRLNVWLPFNPRKGICLFCGKTVSKGEIASTNLHHFFYEFPTKEVRKNHILALKNTVELCYSCHTAIHKIQEAIKPENYPIFLKLLELAPENIRNKAKKFIRMMWDIEIDKEPLTDPKYNFKDIKE